MVGKRWGCSLGSLLVVIGIVAGAGAKVLPPPVNQFIGIYDTRYPNLTTGDCLDCHVSHPLMVQRHHALIQERGLACLDCHTLIPDGSGGYALADFRTCLVCHTSTPHHSTAAAQQGDCTSCHGSLVDRPDDGHYVPAYPPSSMTPLPDGRTEVDPATGATVIVNGCAACHQADPNAVDPRTGTSRPIVATADLHHGTGLTCTLCHNSTGEFTTIRTCERCHSLKSLHNIQLDSDNPATLGVIIDGQENPGWGHIGASWDCIGCHDSWLGFAGPELGATVPVVTGQSAFTLTAGAYTILTLAGASFTNTDGVVVYQPRITIANASGSLTLIPFSITESELKVTVPPLADGNYELRVIKDDRLSNRRNLTVVPALVVRAALLGAGNTLTVSGSGFGAAPPAEYPSTLGVFTGSSRAEIVFWSDSRIVAISPDFAPGSVITVRTLFGSASRAIYTAPKKSRR